MAISDAAIAALCDDLRDWRDRIQTAIENNVLDRDSLAAEVTKGGDGLIAKLKLVENALPLANAIQEKMERFEQKSRGRYVTMPGDRPTPAEAEQRKQRRLTESRESAANVERQVSITLGAVEQLRTDATHRSSGISLEVTDDERARVASARDKAAAHAAELKRRRPVEEAWEQIWQLGAHENAEAAVTRRWLLFAERLQNFATLARDAGYGERIDAMVRATAGSDTEWAWKFVSGALDHPVERLAEMMKERESLEPFPKWPFVFKDFLGERFFVDPPVEPQMLSPTGDDAEAGTQRMPGATAKLPATPTMSQQLSQIRAEQERREREPAAQFKIHSEAESAINSLRTLLNPWCDSCSEVARGSRVSSYASKDKYEDGWEAKIRTPDLEELTRRLCAVGDALRTTGDAKFIDTIAGDGRYFEMARLLVRDAIHAGPEAVRKQLDEFFVPENWKNRPLVRDILTVWLTHSMGVLPKLSAARRDPMNAPPAPPVEQQAETLACGDDVGGRQQSSLPPRAIQHKLPVSGNAPANMATIVLLTVNEHETHALLDEFVGEGKSPQHETKGNVTYNKLGSHGGCQIVHTRCEMGSVGMGASQQRTRQAIDHWQPQAIVAVGIAFGMDELKQGIGDVLVSTQIQDYELSRQNKDGTLTPRGDKPSCSPSLLNRFRQIDTNEQRRNGDWPKVQFGLVLSGQKLVDDLDYRESLKRLFTESIGGEMEGTGVYVSAQEKKIDWIVVKAICDWGHNKNDAEKDAWQQLAAKNAARVLKSALDAGGLYET